MKMKLNSEFSCYVDMMSIVSLIFLLKISFFVSFSNFFKLNNFKITFKGDSGLPGLQGDRGKHFLFIFVQLKLKLKKRI